MQREMSVLKRHLRAISMEKIHEFQVTCQQTQVSYVSNTPTSKRLLRKYTRWIQGQKYFKNMPENDQTTLYALRYAKRGMGWCPHVSVDKKDISF